MLHYDTEWIDYLPSLLPYSQVLGISLSLFTKLAKGGVTLQAVSDSETLVDS